jgi:hypothetical protein
MVKSGEITQATFDEWNAATPKKLPERITPKKKKKVKKNGAKSRASRKRKPAR